MAPGDTSTVPPRIGLGEVVVQWGRIGCLGFGGPPTHIAMFRDLCVTRRKWIAEAEFEDSIAVCNLLPGPSSTQLAILCAWNVAGPLGAIVGGAAFIIPGLVLILGLASVFLATSPPLWVLSARRPSFSTNLLTPRRQATPDTFPVTGIGIALIGNAV